jgi:hypothetical protein
LPLLPTLFPLPLICSPVPAPYSLLPSSHPPRFSSQYYFKSSLVLYEKTLDLDERFCAWVTQIWNLKNLAHLRRSWMNDVYRQVRGCCTP